MDFLSMFKIFLDLITLFVLGFSFGIEKLKFKRYCYNALGIISIILTLINTVYDNFILSLIYGLFAICWFTLSIICKKYEDKILN